jgi:hypothetical protein
VTYQPVESAKGAVELSGGVVYLRWDRGAVVQESDARAVMARVSALCSGSPRPMLVDINSMEGVEHKARSVFAAAWPLTGIAVVGASPVDRLIVDYYLARHTPVCPTRFFTSAADAMSWLGIGASRVKNPYRLPAGESSLVAGVRGLSQDARDADAMLNVLLARVEAVLADIRTDANAMPLFVVEERLTKRLRDVLPGVRFAAEDIRTWSAAMSS